MADEKPPYSDTLLRLVSQIQEAKTHDERANLMMNLASQFLNEHDFTDAELEDVYHNYFEEYQEARLRFQQAALRVGRLALHEIQGYCDQNSVTLPRTTKTMAN
jgi:hypothetical protein